jgi:hypothetical protein
MTHASLRLASTQPREKTREREMIARGHGEGKKKKKMEEGKLDGWNDTSLSSVVMLIVVAVRE